MSVRKLGIVIAALCAAMLVVPVAASAQTTPTTPTNVTSFKNIPITGTANNGKSFTGHFNVSQFVARNGKTYALGTLTGKLGNRTIKRSNVAIPVSMGSGSATGLTAHAAATCQILNLVLGPLHLNLLGLHVDLNQVVLNITGVTGAGQLLGNLLCGVANLLNPGLPAGQLAGLLNIVQQILNNPGLLAL